ncbi:hypothetical protein SAY87_029989 [Trapa incisa]|uniref:RING-type E3 ubiquitin transferase n=1 Tax=Trapa incisa TaxID=236973 RepID=A0AAN7K7I9_9MYRT|nr:hypothetical protein SAY87_029989 [Trapa incisa]
MEISPAAASPGASSSADASPSSVAGEASISSKSGPASSAVVGGLSARYDDDDDGDVCRICRNPGDAENPLRYPCACSGSIKFVHQDCLLQWLDHSNARQCEVCKHAFSFSPVYAENAPVRLPFQEFVVGMAVKACHVLKFFLHLSFVFSVWLIIIPFITFWIWRLDFVRTFSEAQRLFLSHLSTTVILTDCLHGFLLSASIVFIFLGATSLRDYFWNLRELGCQDAERENARDRNGARAERRLAAQPNQNVAGDVDGEDAADAQGLVDPGQMMGMNAENVAVRWEMQAARLEAHVEQMFDGLDDADGTEEVPFDELVGMQGPVFHLVENAFTTALAGVRYTIEHIRSKRAAVLLAQISKWCCIVFKSSALLSIWVFVIPVLIGLLFELLVIVPMRVPMDESPVFLLYQDWALGLIFLKIWTRLVMFDQMLPFVDESWRWKFERVREDGFSRLQGLWVLQEIVLPIMMKLLTALCVPYVLARGVFPVLGIHWW